VVVTSPVECTLLLVVESVIIGSNANTLNEIKGIYFKKVKNNEILYDHKIIE
jgi:hypothetical protein